MCPMFLCVPKKRWSKKSLFRQIPKEVVDKGFLAVFEDVVASKIDEDGFWDTKKARVGHGLSIKNRDKFLDCLQFDHNATFDKKVILQLGIQVQSFVVDRHNLLALDLEAAQPQLLDHASFIDLFQKPRPQFPVDIDSSAEDLVGQFGEVLFGQCFHVSYVK